MNDIKNDEMNIKNELNDINSKLISPKLTAGLLNERFDFIVRTNAGMREVNEKISDP